MRVVLLVLLLAALAAAQLWYWDSDYREAYYYEWYNPVYQIQYWDGPGTERYNVYVAAPAVWASPVAPDRRTHNFTFSRAVALFEIPRVENVTALVKWYLPATCLVLESCTWERYLDLGYGNIEYAFFLTVKVGEKPVIRWNLVSLYGAWPRPKVTSYWSIRGVGDVAEFYQVKVYYRVWVTGKTELCVTYREYTLGVFRPYVDRCVPYPRAYALNFTAVAYDWGLVVYANGTPVFRLATRDAPPPAGTEISALRSRTWRRPWITVEPTRMGVVAGIDIKTGSPTAPVGKAYLFVGNETLSLPRYVANLYTDYWFIRTNARAVWDGLGVVAAPPPFFPSREGSYRPEFVVMETPVVDFVVHGERKRLRLGTFLPRCEVGEPVVKGAVRLFDVYVVAQSGHFYCSKYPVRIRLPNGTVLTLGASPNSTFVYTPPAAYFGNGTRLVDPRPIRVRVNYSAVEVEAKYAAREYLVVVETPLGAVERWARRGEVVDFPSRVVDLNNGTRLVLQPLRVVAERPVHTAQNYTVMYRVEVVMPNGSLVHWVERGAAFRYAPPDFLDLGNQTALRRPNGTCVFKVERPARCVVHYAERLYYAKVKAPFGVLADGWLPAGSAVEALQTHDFGNGTRLVDPAPSTVIVDKPVDVSVAYRRQYFIEIRGVEEWSGWAYEGSSIRLNETYIGGVKYTPIQPEITATRPGVYRPVYQAVYFVEVRDLLGLPNPWAAVELCGRKFTADSAGRVYASVETQVVCELKVEKTALGPYGLVLVVVAVVVVVVVAVARLGGKR